MKKLLLLCLFSPAVWANNTCASFTELFEQRDFPKIESMFKRAVMELGYPESSVYLNEYYAKSHKDQVSELRRVYRGCYSLRKQDEHLVNLIRKKSASL